MSLCEKRCQFFTSVPLGGISVCFWQCSSALHLSAWYLNSYSLGLYTGHFWLFLSQWVENLKWLGMEVTCGRKRVESLHKHATHVAAHSISGHSIQESQCQWQCCKLQGTENPLTQCPYISYAAANPYSRCLGGVWNIPVGLYACLPYTERS